MKYNANQEVKKALSADLKKAKFLRLGFYVSVVTLLLLFGAWKIFLLYWLVPMVWIFPLIVRLKNISEHCGLSAESELQGSRDVTCSWLEGWLIAPHYIRLHLAHHLYPSVPFYHLPKMHRLLTSFPVYREQAHQNSTYLLPSQDAVWRDLTCV
jgi:fatty acid desaturase